MQRSRGCQKLLACVLMLASALGIAQGIPIGRSTVSLPDPQRWEVAKVDGAGLTYSGDKDGDIPLDARRLVLRAPSGAIKVVVLSRVTKGGVSGMHMSWENDCKAITQSDYLYKRDQGTITNVDCLAVGSVNNPEGFLARAPTLQRDLGGMAPEGAGFYYVMFANSIGSGGYTNTEMLVAWDFKGLENVPIDNLTRLPTPIIAWAAAFASNNRSAITSLSGKWAIPAMVFSD